MSVKRKCPECGSYLPIGSGVVFDKDHNVLCNLCGAVILPAKADKERKCKFPIQTTTLGPYGRGHNQAGWQGHDYDGYSE